MGWLGRKEPVGRREAQATWRRRAVYMARVSKFSDEQKSAIALDLPGGKLSHGEICRKTVLA